MEQKRKRTYCQQQANQKRRELAAAQKRQQAARRRILWLAAALAAALAVLFAVSRARPAAAQVASPAVETASPAAPAGHNGITDEERRQLDALCAGMPGNVSVYLTDLDSGDVFAYNADTTSYYAASMLKAPYALWLCSRADAGTLDLTGTVANPAHLWVDTGRLAQYAGQDTVPALDALNAMIVNSSNNATTLLAKSWPATEEFRTFLTEDLQYVYPETCEITDVGIAGYVTAGDISRTFCALYDYFRAGQPYSLQLKAAFLSSEHNILYVPDGVAAAKKYGSWTDAFHDAAVVYAPHPYVVAVLSDWGDETVDYPPRAVADMQALGKLIWQVTQDEDAPESTRATPGPGQVAQSAQPVPAA